MLAPLPLDGVRIGFAAEHRADEIIAEDDFCCEVRLAARPRNSRRRDGALVRVANHLAGFISIRESDTVNYFHYPVPFIIQRRIIQRREAARANVSGYG